MQRLKKVSPLANCMRIYFNKDKRAVQQQFESLNNWKPKNNLKI